MRFVTNWAFALGLLLILPTAAKCDLVFSVVQRTPGDIELGSNATFDLFVRSTTENQGFSFLGVQIRLSDTTGAGGRISLTNATSELAGGWEDYGPAGDPTAPEGGFLVAYFGDATATISSFGLNNTRIGSFDLSTTGATIGSYAMNFQDTTALTTSVVIPSSGVSTSYTLSAVPEPTSMALVCVAGVGAVWGYRRRAKDC